MSLEYHDLDLVVRPEGGVFRVLRSRYHARGDLITKTVLDDIRGRSKPAKVLILPEGSAG